MVIELLDEMRAAFQMTSCPPRKKALDATVCGAPPPTPSHRLGARAAAGGGVAGEAVRQVAADGRVEAPATSR